MKLIGHNDLRSELSRLLEAEQLPHSLLLAGPKSVGKSLLARELSKAVLCEGHKSNQVEPCQSCVSCKLIEANNHPDFFIFNCKNEGVEELRSLLSKTNLSAFRGKAKVILLLAAEDLNLTCANVLLKTLEEPRKSSYFFLVTSQLNRMLATVKSRCQTFKVGKLEKKEVLEVIKLLELQIPKDAEELIAESGSLEKATISESIYSTLKASSELFLRVLERDREAAFEISALIGKDKEALPIILESLRNDARLQIERRLDNRILSLSLCYFIENAIAAQRLIFERNLNPSLVLNFLFNSVIEALESDGVTPPELLEKIAL